MIGLLLAVALAAAPPEPAGREAEVTAAAIAALEARDPALADAFRQADQARAAGDLATAGRLYAAVAEATPDLAPAWRRHCLVLHDSGQRSEALARCRHARGLSSAPEDAVGLAYVLLDVPSGAAATPGDRAEAGALLAEARAVDPDDPVNARLRCHLAMEEDHLGLLQECVADMQRLAPDHVMTHWHAWSLAHRQERWGEALAALERAREAGMPEADVEAFRRLTLDSRPWWTTWGPALGVGALLGGATWLLGRRLRRVSGRPARPPAR